ncbi:hypothetical protein Pelo_19453 [Pelomyxa schiedti]|nr:hypothetical protein Pelo_19453 [Pelomyxa schiedti]
MEANVNVPLADVKVRLGNLDTGVPEFFMSWFKTLDTATYDCALYIILDSCYSGSWAQELANFALHPEFHAFGAPYSGNSTRSIHIWTSCGPTECASESDTDGGYFTQAVLPVLNQWIAQRPDPRTRLPLNDEFLIGGNQALH